MRLVPRWLLVAVLLYGKVYILTPLYRRIGESTMATEVASCGDELPIPGLWRVETGPVIGLPIYSHLGACPGAPNPSYPDEMARPVRPAEAPRSTGGGGGR